MDTAETISLAAATPGTEVRLVRVAAGRRARQRLADLGLTPGVAIRVLQNGGGPVILSVRGTRLALGRGIALAVEVTAV